MPKKDKWEKWLDQSWFWTKIFFISLAFAIATYFYGTFKPNSTITVLDKDRNVTKTIEVTNAYSLGELVAGDITTGSIIEANHPISLYSTDTNGIPLNVIHKNYGTLAFSGIARSAFVATSILRDLQKKSIITENDLANFYSNINTITNELNKDLYLLELKKIKKNFFLNKYGHLRPSTY